MNARADLDASCSARARNFSPVTLTPSATFTSKVRTKGRKSGGTAAGKGGEGESPRRRSIASSYDTSKQEGMGDRAAGRGEGRGKGVEGGGVSPVRMDPVFS